MFKKKEENLKTVEEISAMFNVSGASVRRWIADGLPYKKEKIIGRRTRVVIDPDHVIEYHKSKES